MLHVVCDLTPGGAEHLILELCKRRASGFDVEVATVQGGGALEGAFREAGIPLVLGTRKKTRGVAPTFSGLLAAVGRADVVHTHLFAGDTWGRLAAMLARKRAVVTTEHNVNRDETWQRHVKRGLAPASRVIVAVSEAVARHTREVEGIDGGRVVVIPNGVDLTRFRPGPPRADGPLRLLAVGRRVPQKGFDVLLDALPPGMTLRIAGEGPFRRDHPQVEWLGHVADPAPLYASSDVLVVPSRWEGFGLVAAEGLAAGLPVVASRVDGLVEVIGDAGLLVPPEDPAALREALVELARDPDRRGELGRRARARAEAHFDLDAMVRAYEALYLRILAGA